MPAFVGSRRRCFRWESPARLRDSNALDDHLEDYSIEYVALAGRLDHHPSGISAPVFDRRGRVVLALTAQALTDLSEPDAAACQ